jgi:uncharacterized repeat protein (TIGR01451 family)
MFKRFFVLVGTAALGLVALAGLMGLLSPPSLVVHADPLQVPSAVPPNASLYRPANQVAAQDCVTITSDIVISDTWTASCYRVVTSTVTIQPGATLTISPPVTGTRVEFQNGAQLQIFGNLQALGTASRPITFTSADAASPGRGDWLGIILEDDSGGDFIQYSVIEYARTGVKINDEDNVSILSNTFRYNGGSESTNGAIGGDTDYSHIANNRIYSCTNGIAIGEAGYNTIVSNTIYSIDRYGIILLQGGVGGGSDNDIADNVIFACASGGMRLEDGFDNRVYSNVIYLNPGGGIYLDDQSVVSVRYNHVYSNGGGSGYRAAILITDTAFLSDVVYNVVYDEHAEAIEYDASNVGASPWMAFNALCSIPSFELQNGDSATVSAPHNWWSTNNPTDSVSGLVDFAPWINLSLEGTTAGMVTVSLRDQDGHTVPPPSGQPTSPPAPNARRIVLSTNWGTISPTAAVVNDQGLYTATLIPGGTPAPDTIVLTATDFCGYYVTATLALPNLAITKTTAITQVPAGGVLTYLISYANTSTAAATDVRITDTLPAGMAWAGDTAVANGWTRLATVPPTWFTPTLPAGARGSFVLSVTVVPTACGLSLTNWVTIGTPLLETTLADNAAHAPTVTAVCASLAIAKVADPPQGPPGRPVNFTVVYTNDGDTAVANAVVTDWLPANTRYLSDTSGLACPACIVGAPGPLTWTIPSLPPSSTYRFTLTLSYASTACPATLTNTIAISATVPDLEPADNVYTATYHVACDVDLVVVKDDDVGPTSPTALTLLAGSGAGFPACQSGAGFPACQSGAGFPACQSGAGFPACQSGAGFPACQSGAGFPACQVDRVFRTALEQALLAPAQHREFVCEGDLVTYTIAIVNVGTYTATHVVLTETLPEYSDYVGIGWTQVNSRTFTQTVGSLTPGDGRIYYFVVRVHDPLPAGVNNLVNHVCGRGDEPDVNPEDNCHYEDTPVRRCWLLRVEKSAEACISPGDEFTYQITYRNTTTDTTFHNVRLTDTLPIHVSYAGGPGWSCVGQVCNRAVISIPPEISGTLLLPVRLSATFPYTLQTSITNVVEIQAGNRFVLVTPVDTGPDLSVVKNDNVGPLPLSQQARLEAMSGRLSTLRPFSLLQPTQHREFVRPGERITYTILYLNDGFGPATGVVLTETLPQYTHYVGGGWTQRPGRQYTLDGGDLAPGQGGQVQFIVQVDDPFPPGVDRVVNRVDIGGETAECNQSNDWSADDTPVHTNVKLYVANRHSGAIDVFNTTNFDHITTIPVGVNPYGMATYGDLLFVADFAEAGTTGRLYVVNTLSDTVIASTQVGAHPVHVAVYDGYVYIAGHSSPPPITIVNAGSPWNVVTELYLDRYLTYEFGFFGVTTDETRGRIYFTKPDFGSVGIWQLTPTGTTWLADLVYAPVDFWTEKPRSILYDFTTDRVYAAVGLIDELWVLDPDSWELLERIPTGHQDPTDPGYGAHGLAALGQCVFVSNYLDRSVTAVVNGSCVESTGPVPATPPAGPYRIYLPIVGRNFTPGQGTVTIPVSGRPEGMTGMGNLLFVTLSSVDRVAVINTETLTVVDEISVPGDHPHTVILAGGNTLSPAP